MKRISRYQVITPTSWNASPRDDLGQMGPIEQALIGTAVADVTQPIELLRVVHSFDPCLACTVHPVVAYRNDGKARKRKTGKAKKLLTRPVSRTHRRCDWAAADQRAFFAFPLSVFPLSSVAVCNAGVHMVRPKAAAKRARVRM